MAQTVADKILAYINSGNEGSPAELAWQLILNANTVRRVTNELRAAGEIAVIDVYRGAPVYGKVRPVAQEIMDPVTRDEVAGL